MKRKWIAVLGALALFAALAGCGKSDDTSVQETEDTPQATQEPLVLPMDDFEEDADTLTDEEMQQIISALNEAADSTVSANETEADGATMFIPSEAEVIVADDAGQDMEADQRQTTTEDDAAYMEIFQDLGPIELPMDYVD
jgi:hypothetical protein